MRLSTPLTLLPLALLPTLKASLATDLFGLANSLVSSESESHSAAQVQSSKNGDVRIMDSWNYVDCGTAADVV